MKNDLSKSYRVRSDVHLVEICGTFLLVSEKKARNECSYVREINDTAAYFWELLQNERGYTLEMLVSEGKEYYEVPDDACLREDIADFLDMLESLHYLKGPADNDKGEI